MWLSRNHFAPTPTYAGPPRTVAIGVPAHEEEGSIAACLAAIDRASHRCDGPVTVVVSANNCTDATAAHARAFVAKSAFIVVEEIALAPALSHAGGARRQAMNSAADVAGCGGIVMTTDADSCVDENWIIANLAEIAAGADAVAGMITFDDVARAELPDLTHRAAEWQLASLQARLEDLIDPCPHDPWPRHIWAWGASLAITVEAYRAIGGIPCVELAEDRALADAVIRSGFRLRRSHAPLVYTSPRRCGRAPGGFADLLASYASDAETPCDAALEPTRTLLRRLALRSRLRAIIGEDFASRWAALEAVSPGLARRRVHPADVDAEVALAERAIVILERRAARRADNPRVALAA